MALKAKHVRSEWQTFVEWPYKKVSTLCGVKTAAHNTGIPGLNPDEIDWCLNCASGVNSTVEQLDGQPYMTNDSINLLYSRAWLAVQPAVERRKVEFEAARQRIAARRLARGEI